MNSLIYAKQNAEIISNLLRIEYSILTQDFIHELLHVYFFIFRRDVRILVTIPNIKWEDWYVQGESWHVYHSQERTISVIKKRFCEADIKQEQ